ncbi:MAG TPA: AraC family transcriptional regulator [Pseudonocardia sp.]|uniref:AraC family transcriptional regulator n=1 Tax=Pseudonocardia sp. TaxID=60912 RepID=UPI002C229A2F|nr:AraC family transcriptional regulator [Pseudonocardia sp.]HTF50288.1 AraC family transcriptional regulator [Pseudonocardia sp.]
MSSPCALDDSPFAREGVRVGRLRTPPGTYQIPSRDVLLIGTHLNAPVTIAVESAPVSRRRQYVFGDSWLIPPGTPFLTEHRETTDDAYLLVDLALVARTAEQLEVEQAQPEIRTTLGTQDPTIQHIAHALLSEGTSGGIGQELYIEALINQLAIHLLRQHTGQPARVGRALERPRSASSEQLRAAMEFIHDNLGGQLSLRDMAAAARLSPHHFGRAFKRATGVAPHQYVLQRRVELARRLLASSGMSIAEVARHVGFYDQSHLSAHVKRVLGVTPGMLRDETAGPLECPQP